MQPSEGLRCTVASAPIHWLIVNLSTGLYYTYISYRQSWISTVVTVMKEVYRQDLPFYPSFSALFEYYTIHMCIKIVDNIHYHITHFTLHRLYCKHINFSRAISHPYVNEPWVLVRKLQIYSTGFKAETSKFVKIGKLIVI